MASQLKNILAFANVASGAQATLAHGLNIDGRGVVPDEIAISGSAAFSYVSADDTNVVVQNDSPGVASCNVFVEYWYSTTRVFLPAQLTPAPFVTNPTASAAALTPQEGIYYVGKHGSDANTGRNINDALLTFGAAMAVASSGDVVVCLDGGAYTERITVPAGVHVYAPNASFTSPGGGTFSNGCFELSADSDVVAGYVVSVAGEAAFVHVDVAGTCRVRCHTLTVSDGARGFLNEAQASGGVLICEAAELFVGQNAIGVGDGALGSVQGHIHVQVGDIYLTGDNAVALTTALLADNGIVGTIDHILEDGAPTGTYGIIVNAGEVILHVGEIVANTVWSVSGTLRIFYGKITGAQAGAGTILTSTPT